MGVRLGGLQGGRVQPRRVIMLQLVGMAGHPGIAAQAAPSSHQGLCHENRPNRRRRAVVFFGGHGVGAGARVMDGAKATNQEATFTPSGVVRIAKLQGQGAAYIKP